MEIGSKIAVSISLISFIILITNCGKGSNAFSCRRNVSKNDMYSKYGNTFVQSSVTTLIFSE